MDTATTMAWYIPLLIFAARICDVSIGTVRTMFVISGLRAISALLGFFEVIIWVLAVGGTLAYLSYPTALIGYAGGFATGVMVGMWIEDRVALGFRAVRIIAPKSEREVSAHLREHGYRVTRVDGHGRSGPVEIAFLVVRRNRLRQIRDLVGKVAPNAFLTIERADRPQNIVVSAAATPASESRFARRFVERAMSMRK